MMSRVFSETGAIDKNFTARSSKTSSHSQRRPATYRAILCALGLSATPSQASEVMELGNLGVEGFRVDGRSLLSFAGGSVSGAGDVNGDGLDDLIIGARSAGDSGRGQSYVIFGKTDNATVELSRLEDGFGPPRPVGGFLINGIDPSDRSGHSVSGAGDVNGDGLADLVIGAPESDPGGLTNAGESYVVFGKTDNDPVDLANLGTGGFQIDGIAPDDFSGQSVAGAGDVNGDGLADLIIGADRADPRNKNDAGETYVVFGKNADSDDVDLARLDSGGFRIEGANTGDGSGYSVAGAGDVNGDGLADLIIGAPYSNPGAMSNAGTSYVVFGKDNVESVDLDNLDTGGFRIEGAAEGDFSGASVSGAGDVNGDGLADLIIGATGAERDGKPGAGRSYVIFGKADSDSVDLANLGTGGFQVQGIDLDDFSGRSVAGAGDVNGDGLADLIVAAFEAPGGTAKNGESYIVFGKTNNDPVDLANLGSGGIRIRGVDDDDSLGYSVSGAGDVNGDGLADLIIGAPFAGGADGQANSGAAYVIFGPRLVASPLFFTDRDRFLRATQAFPKTFPYVETVSSSGFPSEVKSGDIVLTAPSGSSLFFNDWPADFPEDNDIELALNGNENLDIALRDAFVSGNLVETYYAMGIDFNDGAGIIEDDDGNPIHSTFEVTVFIGDNRLASFQFDTSQLPNQNYIGVWSQVPLNRLVIRETPTADENEFFGTVSAGRRPLPNQIFADRFKVLPPQVE